MGRMRYGAVTGSSPGFDMRSERACRCSDPFAGTGPRSEIARIRKFGRSKPTCRLIRRRLPESRLGPLYEPSTIRLGAPFPPPTSRVLAHVLHPGDSRGSLHRWYPHTCGGLHFVIRANPAYVNVNDRSCRPVKRRSVEHKSDAQGQ